MKRRRMIVGLLTALPAALELSSGSAEARQRGASRSRSITTKSKNLTTAPAQDPNVKRGPAKNSANATVPAPPAKGGTATRGPEGLFHADNHTPWYIELYLDGDYIGTVGPWGDLYRYVPAGDYSAYGRAPFDDGHVRTWGPRACGIYGTFVWNLYV